MGAILSCGFLLAVANQIIAGKVILFLFINPPFNCHNCLITAKEEGCGGGILKGDEGNFYYSPSAADGSQAQKCVWILQA